MVVSSAHTLGIDLSQLGIEWTPARAEAVVRVYRRVFANISRAWKQLDGILATTWATGVPAVQMFGPVQITKGTIEGPGGLKMQYGNPRFDVEEQEFRYDHGGRSHKIFGAKALENVCQFLARINIMHDALRISDRGYNFVLQAHDELVFIVPDAEVDDCIAVVLEEMRRPPSWAPGLPLDAEASYGQNYGSAKA
jgi:hypothetical protein